jgi:threonine aldolase
VIFDTVAGITASDFIKKLEKHGILAVTFGPQTVRFVTHLDITEEMMERVLTVLPKL